MDLKNARIDISGNTSPEDYKKLVEELQKIPLRSSLDQYVIIVFKDEKEKTKIHIRPGAPHQDLLERLLYDRRAIQSEERPLGDLLLFDSFEDNKLSLFYNNGSISHIIIYRYSYEKQLKDRWENQRKNRRLS